MSIEIYLQICIKIKFLLKYKEVDAFLNHYNLNNKTNKKISSKKFPLLYRLHNNKQEYQKVNQAIKIMNITLIMNKILQRQGFKSLLFARMKLDKRIFYPPPQKYTNKK